MLERFLPRQDFSSYEDFKENFVINVPENFNFGFDIIDEWGKDKEKRAIVWCDDHGNEKIITYSELSAMSNKAANYLKSLGVKKGDVVMLILRRRWEYWVCAVALHKIGAVLIPGSLQLTKKDIIYRVSSADIHTIICVDDSFVTEQVALAKKETSRLKNTIIVAGERDGFLSFNSEFEKFSDVFPRPAGDDMPKNEDIMLVYFTSGTTGMPKMVRHNFMHPLGHIITAKYWQKVQENKLHMSISDSGWAKFGWGKIYGQMICGATIFAYDMDKFVPKNLLEKISQYKITTFCAPPTMFRFMLQEDVESYDLSSIEHCGIAGEPLNPEVFRKWRELTGLELAEGFGQSETPVIIGNFEWFEPLPGSMGKPSPLYNVELINADGEVCEDGEEGEIVISGIDKGLPVGLFTGYFHDEEMTKQNMGGKYYNTKDVAWRDSNGYFWFVGRNDDVIKCSGYRIGPFEVESALLEHPSVLECAVTAAPDPVRGQVVKATVVLTQNYKPSDELITELQNHVKKVTAPYKYPRIIEFTDELPKTLGGKIKRAEIRSKNNS